MAKKRCLSLAFSLLAVASVHAVSTALAQGAAGTRPISATTTRDWSVQIVTDDLSYPWNVSRVQTYPDNRSAREYRDD